MPRPRYPKSAKKRAAAKAVTANDRAIRIDFVLRMLLQGATNCDIYELTQKDGDPRPAGHGKAWNVTPGTLRHYVSDAYEVLVRETEPDRARLIAYHRATRRNLYNKCLTVNDYRAALAVLDSEAKLLALFAPPPPPSEPAGMTDDDLDAEIREITRPGPAGEAGGVGRGEAPPPAG